MLEQRRLEELAAATAAAAAVVDRSPSPPAASSSSADASTSAASSATSSSMGVLVSGRTSFSAYSDESDGSYVTDDEDQDDVDERRHPASLPVSPAHSDQFMLSASHEAESPSRLLATPPPANDGADQLASQTPPALLPPQAPTKYSRPTKLRTQPSSTSISSCVSSTSSAESAFPTTPGAKHFKGHPLPGLEGSCDGDEDVHFAASAGVNDSFRPVAPVESKGQPSAGSLIGAQFALAQLHRLELRQPSATGRQAPLLLHTPHPIV